MASKDLTGKRVALLVAKGFEEVELTEPKKALEQAGAATDIVSIEKDTVRSWKFTDWGGDFDVGTHIADARCEDYDALVLPGGVMNPDFLRMDDRAVKFVRAFAKSSKPIAAICHGPWTLVEADAVRGRRLTSYPSLRTDLGNAGANWIDAEVIVDKGLVTSRTPHDLPAFCAKLVEEVAEGRHDRRTAAA
jgi:protease I